MNLMLGFSMGHKLKGLTSWKQLLGSAQAGISRRINPNPTPTPNPTPNPNPNPNPSPSPSPSPTPTPNPKPYP
eukprot:scaffold29821_cov27-Phaeocystis_antarctica.AAC.1